VHGGATAPGHPIGAPEAATKMHLLCVLGLSSLVIWKRLRCKLHGCFLDSSKGLMQGECAWRGNSPRASRRSPRSSHQDASPPWPVIRLIRNRLRCSLHGLFLDSSKGLLQGECAWRGNGPRASHRSLRGSHHSAPAQCAGPP